MYIHAPMSEYVHMSAGAHRGQKRVLHLLELELQAAVSCPMWVFRLNLGLLQKPVLLTAC